MREVFEEDRAQHRKIFDRRNTEELDECRAHFRIRMQFLEPGDLGVQIVWRGSSQLCQQCRRSTEETRPFGDRTYEFHALFSLGHFARSSLSNKYASDADGMNRGRRERAFATMR